MTAAAGDITVGLVAGGPAERVAALEALPIDSLWVGGHVASRNPSTEAMVALARLSALTTRVKVGTSVLLLPLYPPAIVAKQIADLDRATGGRVVLGVGVGGEYPQEFRACQVPVAERGRRADEAIPLLRRLWTGEEISHQGRFYAMDAVKVHPAPAQRGGPPVIVAGRREAAMRRAAVLGDGWMPYMYSPERYRASVETIRGLAAGAGRDLAGFGWYAWVFLNIGDDGEEARRQAALTMGGQYNQDFRDFVDRVAAAGTPEEVRRRLEAFIDAGARHFIFMPAVGDGDPDAVITRLLDEIVPGLRGTAG